MAPLTATTRTTTAASAVDRHPELLDLCGSGRVSMAGIRKAVKATEVLDPELCRLVDKQLAADVTDDRLTPGMLERAATRRTLAADPDAAAKRAAAARADRRIRLTDTVDGAAAVVATLPAEQALAVFTCLEARARGMRADGDERSLADLMCDLLVEDVTGHRRQFGVFRDQRCRLSDARITDLDHIREVQDGGATTAANGQGLAKNPHVVKGHPGITVTADPVAPHGDGLDDLRAHAPTVNWIMPTGHSYPLRPPPALDWGSQSRDPAPQPAPPKFDDSVAITARLTQPEPQTGSAEGDARGARA